MIKLFLVIVIAGLIFVGMNWKQISGKVESGIDTTEQIKENAMDIKEQAQDKLDDTREKMDDAKESISDLVEKVK